MTLLSILGSDSIAVPLSSGFPPNELRYILENSDALMFLSSAKFKVKADEVLKDSLEKKPTYALVDKIIGGAAKSGEVRLQDDATSRGGMMLYTSGTTSRPVSDVYLPQRLLLIKASVERCFITRIRSHSSVQIVDRGMEIHA